MTPTCGTCRHWQIIDTSQLADGTDRALHVGRCRNAAVLSTSSARIRGSLPRYREPTCHTPTGVAPQRYADYATPPKEG